MTIRIGTGLASGNDNTAIINALLTARQVPVTRLEAQVEDETTLLSIWGEIDTKVSELEDLADQLSSFSVWNQKNAISSDETLMTATASTSTSAVPGTYSISISTLATADQYKSTTQTSSTTALGLGGTFTINGQEITVTTDNTLTDIMNSINSVSGDMTKQVRAYIVSNTLFLKSSSTGTDNAMTISDGSGSSVLTSLGILGTDANHTSPTNLAGTVEGVVVSCQTNTGITSFISGVTINLTDTGETTLTVANDTDTIKSLLQTFVDDYNDLNSYMSDSQAVSFNSAGDAISSTGYLQGDLLANSLQNRIRSLVSKQIDDSPYINSSYNSLSKLGIYVKSDTDELTITDEDTLDNALTSNFNDIKNLFRMTDPETGEVVGVMKNLQSYLYNQIDPVDGNISQRQTDFQSDIDSKNDKITELNTELASYENSLYEHFSAAESIQAQWTSQMSYLTDMLGSS